jgi:prepilin-type N-terminal cleavage/methylation domain-containing protein
MDATTARKRPRRGFTLVELLTVVVIIGILAGLITASAIIAGKRAKTARIAMEIASLDMALKAYKEKFNEYPPDFTAIGTDAGKEVVLRHLARAYPRYPLTGTTAQRWAQFKTGVEAIGGIDVDQLEPSQALVFWLGGMPDGADSRNLMGFSANPANPFDTSVTRIGPFFDFDPERLTYDGSQLRYFPAAGGGNNVPYVYFKPLNGDYTGRICGNARPYWDVRTDTWVNAKTFQIISGGLDGKFGDVIDDTKPPDFPTGANFWSDTNEPDRLGQHDNITNFSEGGTLEDKMP